MNLLIFMCNRFKRQRGGMDLLLFQCDRFEIEKEAEWPPHFHVNRFKGERG